MEARRFVHAESWDGKSTRAKTYTTMLKSVKRLIEENAVVITIITLVITALVTVATFIIDMFP